MAQDQATELRNLVETRLKRFLASLTKRNPELLIATLLAPVQSGLCSIKLDDLLDQQPTGETPNPEPKQPGVFRRLFGSKRSLAKKTEPKSTSPLSQTAEQAYRTGLEVYRKLHKKLAQVNFRQTEITVGLAYLDELLAAIDRQPTQLQEPATFWNETLLDSLRREISDARVSLLQRQTDTENTANLLSAAIAQRGTANMLIRAHLKTA